MSTERSGFLSSLKDWLFTPTHTGGDFETNLQPKEFLPVNNEPEILQHFDGEIPTLQEPEFKVNEESSIYLLSFLNGVILGVLRKIINSKSKTDRDL